MKVVLTGAAYDDLLRIGQFIKRDSPARATTFVAELHARCRRVGTMPKAFPLVPGHEDEGIRRRPYRDYLIFYRVGPSAVEILHILHGAQDYDAVLFPDD